MLRFLLTKSTNTGPKKCADMKKTLILILLCLISFCSFAQNDELNRLTDIVKSLQAGGESAYKAAIATLAKDKRWTPMDELGIDRNVECKASERVPGFRLNAVLTNAENAERYQTTTGNHLNGADSRYNYSLFEKTLKAGKTATFSLSERWGEQTIIVIPYQGADAKISVTATGLSSSAIGNGIVRLTGNVKKGSPLRLNVTNGSTQNISYVIINYNSRK